MIKDCGISTMIQCPEIKFKMNAGAMTMFIGTDKSTKKCHTDLTRAPFIQIYNRRHLTTQR